MSRVYKIHRIGAGSVDVFGLTISREVQELFSGVQFKVDTRKDRIVFKSGAWREGEE